MDKKDFEEMQKELLDIASRVQQIHINMSKYASTLEQNEPFTRKGLEHIMEAWGLSQQAFNIYDATVTLHNNFSYTGLADISAVKSKRSALK